MYSRPSSGSEAITLKTLTGRVSDSLSVCNLIAKQFSSIVNPNVPEFNKSTPCPDNNFLRSIQVLSIDDVVSAGKELGREKLCGKHGTPAFIIKGCFVILASVLQYIFNMSSRASK